MGAPQAASQDYEQFNCGPQRKVGTWRSGWSERANTVSTETKFFDDSKIYLTWGGALQDVDLSKAKDYEDMKRIVTEAYPGESRGKIINNAAQIWAFVSPMKPSDWVAVPRKSKRVIAFGEITSNYTYTASAPTPYRHSRTVKWLNQDVPRTAFDQDLPTPSIRSCFRPRKTSFTGRRAWR